MVYIEMHLVHHLGIFYSLSGKLVAESGFEEALKKTEIFSVISDAHEKMCSTYIYF